jgi:hypothetical protein
MSVNELILAEGDEARKNNEKKTSNRKVRFLKEHQSFKGRLISSKFVQFAQHGVFVTKGNPNNIQSHACLDPRGRTNCPSCKAGVKRTIKTLVFAYDADNGEIVVRDFAKSSMSPIYAFIDGYGEKDNEFAIQATPVQVSMGEKGAVTVMPLAPKDAKGVAAIPDDVAIDEDLLTYVMGVRTPQEIEALIVGKTSDAADVTIEKVDEAQKPATNADGTQMF